MRYITSRDNQYIRQACKLKMAKYRNKEQVFLVEGYRLFQELLKRKDLIIRVFINDNSEEKYRDLIVEQGIEGYLVSNNVFRHLSDTLHPQGVIAVAKKPEWNPNALFNRPGFFILLDRISDPGNMGTIIRTSWAFGVDGVLITDECVDPFNPKVVRAAMGGIFHLPVINISVEDLEILKNRWQLMCATIDGTDCLYSSDFTGNCLVVIGSEAKGVSEQIRKYCQKTFKIPMNPEVDSLNAAVAGALVISEAYRQRKPGFLS
ncbi:MAG: TrmH family RNA methyltransferase [Syntrophomonadaceae bacterium]|jgi:TrmH family RNA methyltransferase